MAILVLDLLNRKFEPHLLFSTHLTDPILIPLFHFGMIMMIEAWVPKSLHFQG